MLGKHDAEKCWNAYLKTLNNGNVNDTFLTHSNNNTYPELLFLTDAKAPLKSLLSLKPAKEEKN